MLSDLDAGLYFPHPRGPWHITTKEICPCVVWGLYLVAHEKHVSCMKKVALKSFMARVRASLPDLHPSERRLAEAVLDFPGDMAGYSASEIAELAGVSNATVSRFVRKIGYASYDEARKAVRDESHTGAALLRFGATDGNKTNAVASHLEQSRFNLEQSFKELDVDVVDDLVTAVQTAPRVWVAGFRAGYPLANYLAWQIGQVLPQVILIPRSGETLAETAATFEKDDVLILLAIRRAPKLATILAETAIAAGTQTAVIGDMPALEALPVKWRFPCATSSSGPLLNHTGVLAVCNLIAARALELSGANGRTRLGRIEDIHDRFGEL